jgi:hypothetical protein
MQRDSANVGSLWACPKCGWAGPNGNGIVVRVFPMRCLCGHVTVSASGKLPTYMTCPHRGQALAEINARKAGCGCASSVVQVFRCQYFDEPVLRSSPERCAEAIREQLPAYTGRTCRECSVWRES